MENELPQGWEWVTLEDVALWGSGGTPNRSEKTYYDGNIPWVKTGDLNDSLLTEASEYITELGMKNSSAKLFPKGSVAIAMYGATIGKLSLLGIDATTNQACGVAQVYKSVNNKFLFYYLKSQKEVFIEKGKGGAQPNISQTVLKQHPFPLPPLAEQTRIVAKLDAAFGHLETLKTSLSRIPELLKKFRQTVLSQAVTGKLTETENVNNGREVISPILIGETTDNIPTGWKWQKLTDLAQLESGHTPRKSVVEYWGNGDVPWISLQDIRAAHGKVISETKYMPTALGIKNSSARLLPKGTVCFCRDISVGYTTVMGKAMSTTQHFANWICGPSLYNMYLLYAFMASQNSLISSSTGTTVGTIYMPALKELRILLPPFKIQHEIVARAEALFAKADALEAQYLSLKAKIDALPSALLAKAFRGALVPQNPADEPASVLLARLKAAPVPGGKTKPGQTKLAFM